MTHPPQPSGWPDQPWTPPVPGNPHDPSGAQPISGQPVAGQPTSGQPYTTPPPFDASQAYGPPPSYPPPPPYDPNQAYAAPQPPPAPYDPNQAYAAPQPPPAPYDPNQAYPAPQSGAPYDPNQAYAAPPPLPAPYDPNQAYATNQAPYGGYGYPAYGASAYPVAPKTNGMAIASLVVSIISALGLCAWGVGGLPGFVGAILGHVARRQIRERGEAGDAMALTGVIVGWIATGLAILATIGWIAFIYWWSDTYRSSLG